MPYIEQDVRQRALHIPQGAGELDYQLTMFILNYLARYGAKFETMNTVVGVLENVKDEFQRRVMHPYEDTKQIENGEVYPGGENKI